MGKRKRALVVCPGRGTYNKDELGYLARYHSDRSDFIRQLDELRAATGQETLSELDGAERFSPSRHMTGDNASALIYACAQADFLSIDREEFEIVAITGNSMGWYLALACAGALPGDAGFSIVNTMGTLMHENGIGGQMIYPLVDDEWREIKGRRGFIEAVLEKVNLLEACEVAISIELGGMVVLAANDEGMKALAQQLPKEQERYPFALPYHAAFHTRMQAHVSDMGMQRLGPDLFGAPEIPVIDGRGHIWHGHGSRLDELRQYTLREQVIEPYDFTRAVQAGLKEFAPDVVIATGPGNTLGSSIAQSMIMMNWQGLSSKADFVKRQQEQPLLYAMGREDQRAAVVNPS